MTDATTLAPTDAEITEVWGRYDEGVDTRRDLLDRIIAKWGAPAPASVEPVGIEPVAAESRFFDTEWSSCDVEHARWVIATPSEFYGYEARYLYTAAQMLAMRTQLSNEQIDRAIAELGLNYLADAHVTNRAVLRKLCHHVHGINAAQKPQAPALIAAAEAIYALRDLDSHDLPCSEAWPDQFAALSRAITAQKETP